MEKLRSRNSIWAIMIAVLAALSLALMFTACGEKDNKKTDDDTPPQTTGLKAADIVGQWEVTNVSFTPAETNTKITEAINNLSKTDYKAISEKLSADWTTEEIKQFLVGRNKFVVLDLKNNGSIYGMNPYDLLMETIPADSFDEEDLKMATWEIKNNHFQYTPVEGAEGTSATYSDGKITITFVDSDSDLDDEAEAGPGTYVLTLNKFKGVYLTQSLVVGKYKVASATWTSAYEETSLTCTDDEYVEILGTDNPTPEESEKISKFFHKFEKYYVSEYLTTNNINTGIGFLIKLINRDDGTETDWGKWDFTELNEIYCSEIEGFSNVKTSYVLNNGKIDIIITGTATDYSTYELTLVRDDANVIIAEDLIGLYQVTNIDMLMGDDTSPTLSCTKERYETIKAKFEDNANPVLTDEEENILDNFGDEFDKYEVAENGKVYLITRDGNSTEWADWNISYYTTVGYTMDWDASITQTSANYKNGKLTVYITYVEGYTIVLTLESDDTLIVKQSDLALIYGVYKPVALSITQAGQTTSCTKNEYIENSDDYDDDFKALAATTFDMTTFEIRNHGKLYQIMSIPDEDTQDVVAGTWEIDEYSLKFTLEQDEEVKAFAEYVNNKSILDKKLIITIIQGETTIVTTLTLYD